MRVAPEGFRPQDIAAEYASEIAGEVKEDEGAVDAEVQAYVNAVRAAYEQRNAQYGRIVEGYLEAYKAAVSVNQLQLDHALRMTTGRYSDTPGNRTDALYFGGSTVDETAINWPLIHKPGWS